MTIEKKIWYDLVDTKNGDEYLIMYLGRQRNFRKWFKILTIIFSASGIFSAFKSAQIPTIISFTVIGIVQLITSIENFIIHSENDLDKLSKLRMLYYNTVLRLEELWDSFYHKKISDEKATYQFFELRKSANEIEELDKMTLRLFTTWRSRGIQPRFLGERPSMYPFSFASLS